MNWESEFGIPKVLRRPIAVQAKHASTRRDQPASSHVRDLDGHLLLRQFPTCRTPARQPENHANE